MVQLTEAGKLFEGMVAKQYSEAQAIKVGLPNVSLVNGNPTSFVNYNKDPVPTQTR